jgi:hypothetical protein
MLVLDENGNPVPLVDLQGKFIQGLGDFLENTLKTNITTMVKLQNALPM